MAENAANIRNWAFLSPSHSPGTRPARVLLPGWADEPWAARETRLSLYARHGLIRSRWQEGLSGFHISARLRDTSRMLPAATSTTGRGGVLLAMAVPGTPAARLSA